MQQLSMALHGQWGLKIGCPHNSDGYHQFPILRHAKRLLILQTAMAFEVLRGPHLLASCKACCAKPCLLLMPRLKEFQKTLSETYTLPSSFYV
jgi:hypothetical protein